MLSNYRLKHKQSKALLSMVPIMCVQWKKLVLNNWFHSQEHLLQMAGGQGEPKWQKDAADQNFDYMFKLLIIGNSSVGKTSFLFRYADDSFTSAFVSTVGIDFKVKTVFRHDKRVKLQIWASLSIITISPPFMNMNLFHLKTKRLTEIDAYHRGLKWTDYYVETDQA